MVKGPRYPIASLDNGLRILLHLRLEPELRVADVARLLGVANSTAHRLLAALAHRGFVEQDPETRRYGPGPVLAELAAASRAVDPLIERMRPALVEAGRELGETIHLGVRRGRLVHYVDAVESDRTMRVVSRTGRTLPAHCTSIGKALLAELGPADLVELYEEHELVGETDRSITSLDALAADLGRVRRAGYAVNEGESEDGVCSVAVAVHDLGGAAVAAIGCAAPASRLCAADAPAVAKILRRCTERVSAI